MHVYYANKRTWPPAPGWHDGKKGSGSVNKSIIALYRLADLPCGDLCAQAFFLVREALVRAGVLEGMAMVQYGKLAGVAFTIGFFSSVYCSRPANYSVADGFRNVREKGIG